MKAFTRCEGPAAMLLHDNIDTDQIIRIERIAQLKRGQFAPWAFENQRYLAGGSENPDFILNKEPYRHALILIGGDNFGCGSSREMAVWALEEFGIRAIIAPSYGDIFFSNCLQNGLLPITLPREQVQRLADAALLAEVFNVDLGACTITTPSLGDIRFDIHPAHREALLLGQDAVAQTLAVKSQIDEFQERDKVARPWVYMTE
ncbi:MAG TPA: 3-isopropylmalate dehydratase small subunit [Burkholderiaceae bacterium]|nr:3-isopropylmalate dehydratase small subunit [Burkholderiaceae bacterium]